MVDGAHSGAVPVTSEVPQGTVVGPTLFLLFFNDIVDCCVSQMKLPADNAIVYRHIVTTTDHAELQVILTVFQNEQALGKWISMPQSVTFCPSPRNAIPVCILSHYPLSRLMTTWASAVHKISDGVAIAGKSRTKLTAPLESLEELSSPTSKLEKNVPT